MAGLNIAIDCGTNSCRAGHADDDEPDVFPAIVAEKRANHPLYVKPSRRKESYAPLIGDEVAQLLRRSGARGAQTRGMHRISRAKHNNGLVQGDWFAMSAVYTHVLNRYCARDRYEAVHLTITTSPFAPRSEREKMAETLFEAKGVGELTICLDSFAAGIAETAPGVVGQGSCVVLDVGIDQTRVSCFQNGCLARKERVDGVNGSAVEQCVLDTIHQTHPEVEFRSDEHYAAMANVKCTPLGAQLKVIIFIFIISYD